MASPVIFDRPQVRRQRARAAAQMSDHAFLFDWAMENLIDRLGIIKRRFPATLQLGGRCSPDRTAMLAGAIGAEKIIILDNVSPSPSRKGGPLPLPSGLRRAEAASAAQAGEGRGEGLSYITADEEHLPFAPQSFDLALSPLTLHTVNDLPGALIQIRRCLKPDGLFVAALPGGATLQELRECLMQAELNLKGGVHPRVAPFADKQQMGALMQRAGFALPVVDSETVTVSYKDIFRLLHDLRGMGETSAIAARSRAFTGKALWQETEKLYRARFAETDGRLRATFEIIFLIGWAPHASQQKPLRPGSAVKSLADALGTAEIGTGEKATP